MLVMGRKGLKIIPACCGERRGVVLGIINWVSVTNRRFAEHFLRTSYSLALGNEQ